MSNSADEANNEPPILILASASRYRQSQLQQLGFRFEVVPSNIDESAVSESDGARRAQILAAMKSQRIHKDRPDAVVIGADQVGICEGSVLSKPGTIERAKRQLRQMSGNEAVFFSAVCVSSRDLPPQKFVVPTTVRFRELSDEEISRYVELDQPIDCAGSFKSESRGSLLLDSVESSDPSALVGLPLIQLSQVLRRLGINPLAD